MEAAIRYVSEHYAEINLLCLFGARGEYIELVRTYKTLRPMEYIPNGVYYPLYPLLGRTEEVEKRVSDLRGLTQAMLAGVSGHYNLTTYITKLTQASELFYTATEAEF